MRYSYEYKKECVELYRKGQWPETPDGIKDCKNFHRMIRRWHKLEELHGEEALQHKKQNKVWTPEEKLALVSQVLAGKSIRKVSYIAGMENGTLSQWVQKYKANGYTGLVTKKIGRPCKNPSMKKRNIHNPRPLSESELEELIRLRAENAYIKAENEVIKKEIALREEKQAAQLKVKKQQSSKSSVTRDTN